MEVKLTIVGDPGGYCGRHEVGIFDLFLDDVSGNQLKF
jgi:hypothetical protein